ncbi:hypothetical protein AMATHDRAFT_11132 [Amanita thiersii Skay4041]|uniref:Uncharacterized protein n=1 Tax=Amanita thiersii Skay4041 TaxID=703135 RepID=A0A2A9N990_9AGAR|nr:hypothetical protein AMATHDRAFT_11132 [Amanita thiersii Skay4041]
MVQLACLPIAPIDEEYGYLTQAAKHHQNQRVLNAYNNINEWGAAWGAVEQDENA